MSCNSNYINSLHTSFPSLQVKSESNRVGVIHNPEADDDVGYPLSVVVEAIINTDSYVTSAIVNVVQSLLNDVEDYDKITSNIDAIIKLATPVKVWCPTSNQQIEGGCTKGGQRYPADSDFHTLV